MNEITHEYLTVRQVAEAFQVTPRTVYNWIERLGMPSMKIGGVILFDQSKLRTWTQKKQRDN